MYIQLPCLIPLLFPRVLGHGSLALTSAFVFEAFIAHLVNQFSGTRGLPKQMVEKLGVSQTYRVHVSQKCKSTPSAARFAKHLLGEGLVFGIQKGVREADAVSKCLFCSIWKWSCPRILGFL